MFSIKVTARTNTMCGDQMNNVQVDSKSVRSFSYLLAQSTCTECTSALLTGQSNLVNTDLTTRTSAFANTYLLLSNTSLHNICKILFQTYCYVKTTFFCSSSAGSNSLRIFSSDWPTYLFKISGPFTI